MKRFPEIPTDLILSEEAPKTEVGAKPVATSGASAETGGGHTATTGQAVPLKPQATGTLDPISGGQTFILVMFGVLAFIMLLTLTRYGNKNNYGD